MYSKGGKGCVLTLIWKRKGGGVYCENIQYHGIIVGAVAHFFVNTYSPTGTMTFFLARF